MGDRLSVDACRIYNEFADCLRREGEVTPTWNADVCDLPGTEVLAWMEFAKLQRRRELYFERQLWGLRQEKRQMEAAYRETAGRLLRLLDYWRDRLFRGR